MSAKHHARLADIALDNVTTREKGAKAFLRLEVFFTKGGRSAFDGSAHGPGYAVSGLVVEKHGDGVESFMLGAEHAAVVESAGRFSAKKLDELRRVLSRPHYHVVGPFQPFTAALIDVARRACEAHTPGLKAPDILIAMATAPAPV